MTENTNNGSVLRLPAGYASLERFVTKWALDDTKLRSSARAASTIEEMREFYHAAIPLAGQAAESLRGIPIDDLDEKQVTLLKLLLGLVEVGVGVECFSSPHVPNGYPLERVEAISTPHAAPVYWT
ncbi:hypothetical protein [Mycolicibacterium sp. YH-1]|uniref:hypothetical protein n=1 Tax=Mycolicibacterium sp. YH-1 TaxID=2908837 RepID=UPI001F4BEB97|nr:hypothetical protein [Mycolicibacterium sp. YH-1]UNB54557.1 hypothetical protein L0M16_09670 [Mycolicibacterium sp. YH-1]